MKYIVLLLIKAYWKMIPPEKRRKCIFRVSCSNFVYETTKTKGFYDGVKAFQYRFKNCRPGYHLYEEPINGYTYLILPTNEWIGENEIAYRLIK